MTAGATLPWAELGVEVDVDRLRHALQRGLPQCATGEHMIEQLRVLKSRRSSSRRRDPHPITLWLEAHLQLTGSRRSGVQRLYGKAYRDGASAAALAHARRSATATPAFGEPVSHVGELDLLLWAWPNDPALTQLPQLLSADWAEQHLPGGDRPVREQVVGQEVLRYEPEDRATLRYALRDQGSLRARSIYGKTFHDERALLLHERFQHFWRRARTDPGAPLVAEPLGVDRSTRTLWQAAARGVPLVELLDHPQAAVHTAAVGRALACLHTAPLRGSAERPLAHWLAEISRRQQKISRAAPELAARVDAIALALIDTATQLPRRAPGLIHGDCHPEQVWIDRGRVVLFDFDEFSQGDPMEDLASFTIKLEQRPLPDECAARLVRALLDAYREAAPQRWCATTLAWHRAVQALLQASRAFIFQVPGWQRELAARLALTERRVQEAVA